MHAAGTIHASDRPIITHGGHSSLQVGKQIEVHSIKYDGSPHRWWHSEVIQANHEGILLKTPNGTAMRGPKGGWKSQGGQTWFGWDRWFNIYQAPANSTTLRYYVHIATPPAWLEGKLVYIDLEVDVLMDTGGKLRIEDEDEFASAIHQYGYDNDIVQRVREATDEVVGLFDQCDVSRNQLFPDWAES